MSVYLGTFGEVELKRQFDGSSLTSSIGTGDLGLQELIVWNGDEVVI